MAVFDFPNDRERVQLTIQRILGEYQERRGRVSALQDELRILEQAQENDWTAILVLADLSETVFGGTRRERYCFVSSRWEPVFAEEFFVASAVAVRSYRAIPFSDVLRAPCPSCEQEKPVIGVYAPESGLELGMAATFSVLCCGKLRKIVLKS